jgi:hypothetical protein
LISGADNAGAEMTGAASIAKATVESTNRLIEPPIQSKSCHKLYQPRADAQESLPPLPMLCRPVMRLGHKRKAAAALTERCQRAPMIGTNDDAMTDGSL